MVAPAAAQIAGPAAAAGLLPVHVSGIQPHPLPLQIDAVGDVAHRPGRIIHETMAGPQPAVRRHTEVPSPGAAGVRAVRPAMDLSKGAGEV